MSWLSWKYVGFCCVFLQNFLSNFVTLLSVTCPKPTIETLDECVKHALYD